MKEAAKDLQPLSESEITKKLNSFPGWEYGDDRIKKEFVFDSFTQGVKLVYDLAPFCDKIDHHPDVHIYYKKIIFELTRFSIGGKVTLRDFTVAQEIERLYKNLKLQ